MGEPGSAEATVPLPTQPRLPVLDLLRGVAILGILPANIGFFSGSAVARETAPASGADEWAAAATLVLISGKMMTLLSILFGAGLAIQSAQAPAAGRSFGRAYARRMGVLFLIGLAHGLLLWYGDILTSYAVVGMAALLLSRLGLPALRRWMAGLLAWCYLELVVLLVLVAAIGPFRAATPPAGPSAGASPPAAAARAPLRPGGRPPLRAAAGRLAGKQFGSVAGRFFAAEDPARLYRRGTFGELVLHRAGSMAIYALLFWAGIGWYVLLCFLAGIYLLRTGFFQDAPARARRSRQLAGWGLGLGFAIHVAALFLDRREPGRSVGTVLALLGAFPQALGYLGALSLWSASGRAAWLQARLRAVGRLALTNYLAQSVLCGWIFYGYGLGWYGRFGPAAVLGVVVVIWLLELAGSGWWLRCFQIGPAEWAWRSLAEGRPRPLRRRTGAGLR